MTDRPRLLAEPDPVDPDRLDIWLDGEVVLTVDVEEVGLEGLRAIHYLIDLLAWRV